MDKGLFVDEIKPGTRGEGLFCVADKRLLETRNGSPYLAVTFSDRSGQIEGRVWEGARELDGTFDKGDYVHVDVEAQLFRDSLQLKVLQLEKVENEDEVDPALFLPVTPEDRVRLWSELKKHTRRIKNPILSALINEIFSDRKVSSAFKRAPAAKRMHHAVIGGLLEHSVSVARLAYSICNLYGSLDRDILLSGALVHDIGKIDEFSYHRPPIDYTDRGRLLGHMMLGVEIIDDFASRLGVSGSAWDLNHLKHLVLSHHGQREYGSPVLPMTEEALVLHLVDDMDAKLNYLKGLKKEIPEGEYGWTGYQRLLERHFLLSGHVEDPGERDQPSEKNDSVDERLQPGLWNSGSNFYGEKF